MLADASDEVVVPVRFFDEAAFEVDRVAEAVETCKRQCSALCVSRLRTGFAQFCLRRARSPQLARH
eukprot:4289207-Lingulodinium_polyedra.AAC.1